MRFSEVTVLVNKVIEPGNYNAVFNADRFSSGIYFYTISTNNFTATKKMMLIK